MARSAASPLETLAEVARQLAAAHGNPRARSGLALPSLLYLSDSVRSPEPVRVARELPAGTGVVLRHYDHPQRRALAMELSAVCKAGGLTLLIGADPALAKDVDADGVHWPERLLADAAAEGRWRIVTAAVHGAAGLQAAAAAQCDAALLSPIFASASHAGAPQLGVPEFSRLVDQAALPVFALGGVTAGNAAELLGSGAAGIAAIGAFAR